MSTHEIDEVLSSFTKKCLKDSDGDLPKSTDFQIHQVLIVRNKRLPSRQDSHGNYSSVDVAPAQKSQETVQYRVSAPIGI